MFGDRKPFPVALITLDPEQIVPWAQQQGLPTEVAELAEHPDVVALVQADLDDANRHYAQVEQIKKFAILSRDFTLEDGELTPSLKLKRNVVYANYADDFERLYQK
jgi:long-chain acyl-CoA synthetase